MVITRRVIFIALGFAGAAVAWLAIALWPPSPLQARVFTGIPNAGPSLPYTPALPAGSPAPVLSPSTMQQGLSAVVAAVRPAVVSIAAHFEKAAAPAHAGMQFLDPFVLPNSTVGSGVIVHPDGLLLTSLQVVGEKELVQVRLFRADRKVYTARRVAANRQIDLALYQLPVGGKLPFARLGDSTAVRTGDIVVALGSPFGLPETVTHGIVSTSRRDVTVQGRRFADVIQTDAAINQGNSGGPLVDIQARVIGINIAIYSTDTTFSGIGFAVPSNQAQALLQNAFGMQR